MKTNDRPKAQHWKRWFYFQQATPLKDETPWVETLLPRIRTALPQESIPKDRRRHDAEE